MSKSKARNMSYTSASSSSARKKAEIGRLQPLDKNNNNPPRIHKKDPFKKSKDYEKYSLRPRSIQNRIETEKRKKGEIKKEPKPKQKPPPLSKYRRKTANARERSRMREINTAYDLLQKAVPQYPILPTNAQGKRDEKLTKITTLRLVMNYIQTLQSLLTQPEGGRGTVTSTSAASNIDIESDTDSIGNSVSSSSSCASSFGSTSSSTNNSLGSGSEFSPASSYTMSPMSSCSPVGPDCIQTVMRSVVSPAAAAAISANAPNLNNLNLNNVSLSSLTSSHASLVIVGPHQSITTIVTIPSHPHAQAQYSRQLPTNIHHNNHQQSQSQPIQQLHHHHTLPPPPRPTATATSASSSSISSLSSSPAYMSPSAMTSSSQVQLQTLHPLHHPNHNQPKHNIQTSVMSPVVVSQRNPLLCSPQQAILVSNSSSRNFLSSNNNISMGKMKFPPIATSLSSALLRKSMSSFLTDCVQLTNGGSVSMNSIIGGNVHGNNGHRTGSLSSLTESDLSEYTNDLLSDEGSVLDEPMFEDIIGVGSTDLDLFLGTEGLGFSSDLSAI